MVHPLLPQRHQTYTVINAYQCVQVSQTAYTKCGAFIFRGISAPRPNGCVLRQLDHQLATDRKQYINPLDRQPLSLGKLWDTDVRPTMN